MRIPSTQTNQGFTLLEVLLYSALLSVFLAAAFLVLHNVLLTNRELATRHELLSNHELVRTRIFWAASQAEEIEIPLPGETSFTELRFRTGEAAGTSPAAFTFSNGQVFLSLASGTPAALTNGRVRVTDFRATNTGLLLGLQDASRPLISSTMIHSFSLPKF